MSQQNPKIKRVYLDASVTSMVDAPHVPDKELITQEFFRMMAERSDQYKTVVSPVLLGELYDASKEVQNRTLAIFQAIQPIEVPNLQEAEALAQLYAEAGVLSDKHRNDLRHVAYSVLTRCDYLVSWNMRHLVRVQTIERVNVVNFEYNYPHVLIVTPEFITGELSNA